MFLPYLMGERTPHKDANARGAFVGITGRHGRPHMIRSVMEGVTFALRDSMEIMRELGLSVTQVRSTGGGARSSLWRQIQADIYGAEVVTVNAEEGPAFGAAILAAVGTGVYDTVEEATDDLVASPPGRNRTGMRLHDTKSATGYSNPVPRPETGVRRPGRHG